MSTSRQDKAAPVLPVAKPSQPFWIAGLPAATQQDTIRQTAPLPKHRDVVIIGAGVSGASAAFHAAQWGYGKRVLLLDARDRVSSGATGRNGGILHAKGWREWWSLARSRGPWTAWQLVRFEQANRDAIHAYAATHPGQNVCGIESGIDAIEVFPSTRARVSSLVGRLGALATMPGLTWCMQRLGVSTWDSQQCAQHLNLVQQEQQQDQKQQQPQQQQQRYGKQKQQAITSAVVVHNYLDTMWPAKMVNQLVSDAEAGHVCVRTGVTATEVEEVAQDDPGSGAGGATLPRYRVITSRGTVTCNTIIHATNAWVSHLLPELRSKIRPVSNTVIATPPGSPPLCADGRRAGFSLHPGMVYFMQRPDGRVILGGFRHLLKSKGVGVWDDARVDGQGVVAAKRFLQDTFQGYRELGEGVVAHQWTGILGWSCDGLPWVGACPGRPHQFICAGFSGHGMPSAFLCGAAVARAAFGGALEDGPFVAAFAPSLDRHGTSWGTFSPDHAFDD